MSKRFTTAQQNYTVHKLEVLMILEALMKWEDKLIGYNIHIITDHKALEFFKMQLTLMACQCWWMDFMSKFTFDIIYIKSNLNKVVDCLLRYYENNSSKDMHMYDEYVHADACIDPTGEDLPALWVKETTDRVIELQVMQDQTQRSKQLCERQEQREIDAVEMMEAGEAQGEEISRAPIEKQKMRKNPHVPQGESNMTLANMIFHAPNNAKPNRFEDNEFKQHVKQEYKNDKLLLLVVEKPKDYPAFAVRGELVWKKNLQGDEVLCLPRDRQLIGDILTQAHEMVGHFESQRTDEYVCCWYWWAHSAKDI